MENLNQSLKEAVCIDEEVFFGPITDKERKIREQFENLHRNEFKGAEVSKTVEDDESSVYKSFSVDESKYDSFDDSLNEINDKMPDEAKPISLKKSFDKIKSKRSGFYDSLEDVCSLVSNIDKCSISCEVENESNMNSKHFVEDSLKILSLPAANKNNFINDQVHFDDDSLAILECETTFSDSLEEVNVLESIEIEEINDIDNLSIENQNVVVTVNEHSTCPKNLFDTSAEIFCGIKKDNDTTDQEESFDDKNVLYDSLSNSDFKDILTDSLEENKQLKEILSLSKHETMTVYKESMSERNDKLFNVQHVSPLPNLFDTSVQIVSEKLKDYNSSSPTEFLNSKNLLNDSLSNSEIKDVSKDSLEESDKSDENLNIPQQKIGDNIAKSDVYQKQNVLDTSVQIVSEKFKGYGRASSKESPSNKNLLSNSLSNSDIKDVSKDSLEESGKSDENFNISKQEIGDYIVKSDNVYQTQNSIDTAVKIVTEKLKEYNNTSSKELLSDKNLLNNSFTNSDIKDVFKDSLDESRKSNENSNTTQQNISDSIAKSENVYQTQNALETSVQIIYDNASDYFEKKNINNSKERLEMGKSFQEAFNKQTTIETYSEQSFASGSICPFQNLPENFTCNKNIDGDKNTSISNHQVNKDEIKRDISVVSNPEVSTSVNDISNREAISVESCHLKILNDDINIEKDLKFQLHIEVKVGDKKCQIASQDIKIVPVTSEGCKSESNSISTVSVANPLSHSISSTASCIENDQQVMHLNNPDLNLKGKNCDVFRAYSPSDINSSSHKKSETTFTSNITLRAKSSASQTSFTKFNYMDSFSDISLLEALDLSDLSASFFNESVIQSKDSLISLNLYSPDECIQNFHPSQSRNKNKENIPEHIQAFENENFNVRRKSLSPNKVHNSKTPQSLHKCSSFKETSKKTPGTKIPVRKVDNFAIPAPTPSKFTKPLPTTLSAEKVKKCLHSPHSVDSGKKTPGTTPNKIPHICNVRNTIFSKVPQIIPSKKYMNVQSPVAQYIKNNSGPMKTPGIDPVLRDCMNRLMESPVHLHHAHTSGSLKSTKKKA